jgi:electron transport complex protein RnfC
LETGDRVLKLLTFKKGIHPDDYKEFTAHKSIEQMELPDEVFIPLQQHIGAPCKPLVAKGDTVKTGQIIGDSEAFVSSPVHSSVTGTVKKITQHLHPMGTRVDMIQIKEAGMMNGI